MSDETGGTFEMLNMAKPPGDVLCSWDCECGARISAEAGTDLGPDERAVRSQCECGRAWRVWVSLLGVRGPFLVTP